MIGVQAILKAKDHVENPEQTALRESVIRFIIAGALFALPVIYNAMFDAIGGNGLGILGNITSLFGGAGFLVSSYAGQACNPIAATLPSSVGDALCGVYTAFRCFPGIFNRH